MHFFASYLYFLAGLAIWTYNMKIFHIDFSGVFSIIESVLRDTNVNIRRTPERGIKKGLSNIRRTPERGIKKGS